MGRRSALRLRQPREGATSGGASTPRRRRLARRAVVGLWLVAVVCLGVWGHGLLRRWTAQHSTPRPSPTLDGPRRAGVFPPAATPPPAPRALAPGETVGALAIPRLGLDTVVLSGVADAQLDLAPGHFPETRLPGHGGNVAVAGHRDAAFRALREVEVGDRIEVTTIDGDFRYRVRWTGVVKPDETWVLAPTAGERLTLVTCHPFDWVGPAPRRFVVRAELED